MKRSKVLYNEDREVMGVVYFQKKGRLVGCGVYLKNEAQKRPLNIEIARYYAQKEAFESLWEHQMGREKLSTQRMVIDLGKVNYSFQRLLEMSRVVKEGNDYYLMF